MVAGPRLRKKFGLKVNFDPQIDAGLKEIVKSKKTANFLKGFGKKLGWSNDENSRDNSLPESPSTPKFASGEYIAPNPNSKVYHARGSSLTPQSGSGMIIKIYAGNLSTCSTYITLSVDRFIKCEDLIQKALKKYRIHDSVQNQFYLSFDSLLGTKKIDNKQVVYDILQTKSIDPDAMFRVNMSMMPLAPRTIHTVTFLMENSTGSLEEKSLKLTILALTSAREIMYPGIDLFSADHKILYALSLVSYTGGKWYLIARRSSLIS